MTLRALRATVLAAAALLAFASGARSAELVVSAAASLTNAFTELGRAFSEKNPDVRVTFNFAASDLLLAQIAKGAPADVFAAADEDAMNRASRQHLVADETRLDFAANALVLVAPAEHDAIASLAALRDPSVRRIAIGNPVSVPAGRYAREALEHAGMWDALSTKLVVAQNVRQALDYVARGEVDAGFVYATDAALMRDRVAVTFPVPTLTPVRYPAAVVRATRNPLAARRFVDYLASDASRRVLARYGFAAP